MKKFLVLLVVLAITSFSVMAFAAEVTVGGSLEIRSRDFSNLQVLPSDLPLESVVDGNTVPNMTAAAAQDLYNKANVQRDTQNRLRIDINAKTDNVKAKLQLNNDFDTWGQGVEKYSSGGGTLGYREAWVNFNLPGMPVNVNAGHQLLQLGQGYFFRSQHFGSDAWVVANVMGANTFALVDVKAFEINTYSADDVDAYVLLDVFKVSDAVTVGIDLTQVRDRRAALTNPGGATSNGTGLSRALGLVGGVDVNPFSDITLNNIGVNFTAAMGALNLKVEADYQSGEAKGQVSIPPATTNPFGGSANIRANQIIVKGDMNAGAAKVNFTAARGTGMGNPNDNDPNIKQYLTILDIDPHVAFLYEYKVPTAAVNAVSQTPTDDQLHTGFANTTALNLGAGFDVSKSVNIAAQYWYFRATTPAAIHGATNPVNANIIEASRDVGQELDLQLTWKLYDNLTWTWWAGYFMPGDAYQINNPITGQIMDADPATGIQGILAFKF